MIKTYSELVSLATFEQRLNYLKLDEKRNEETKRARNLKQSFYRTKEWKQLRDHIIVRDNGCDMGLPKVYINSKIIVHHIIPIKEKDILNHTNLLISPDNLICVCYDTHKRIHYNISDVFISLERKPYDTSPWKNGGEKI